MTEPTNSTEREQQREQQPAQRMPDQLDLLAMTLVGLQHQNQAMGGAIHAALLQVNMLLAARGQSSPAAAPGTPGATQDGPRVMSRADMGFTGAVPPAGVPGYADMPGRPLPAHPDRTFGAARRREAEQAAAAQAPPAPPAPPAPQELHDTTTTDKGDQ